MLLMDYTLYVWHVLTHRVPALWRFHAVHHIDLDLDASTAVRFHFGELTLSTPWRVAQVVVIGTSPLALSIWQTGLLMSILFHHSNVELPLAIERRLGRVFVTPRMHGIHHSQVRGRDRLQLVERPDGVGLASRDAQAERAAARDHDRRACVSGSERCHAAKDGRAAVRAAEANTGSRRTGTPPDAPSVPRCTCSRDTGQRCRFALSWRRPCNAVRAASRGPERSCSFAP